MGDETNKRFSLKGLHHSNKEDCATALQIHEVIGNNDFPFHLTIEELVRKIKDNEPLILNENSGYDWETDHWKDFEDPYARYATQRYYRNHGYRKSELY